MELSAFTLKLIILLIPGALGALILQRLTLQKKAWTPFRFFVNAIMVGLFAYLINELIIRSINGISFGYVSLDSLSIWDELGNSESSVIPYGEVLLATLTGIIIGLILTKGDNFKWLYKLASKCNLSYKYGDENLFSYYLFNLNEYVYVRCRRQGFTYLGRVKSFSETDELKELVLIEVIVHDYNSSEELYELCEIYLSLLKDDIIIELPKPRNNGQKSEMPRKAL